MTEHFIDYHIKIKEIKNSYSIIGINICKMDLTTKIESDIICIR